jgi:protocatechuate 3,4-dioxygenase beta subunit
MTQLKRDLLTLHDRRASLGILAGAGLWVAGCREHSAFAGDGPAGPPPGEIAQMGRSPEMSGTAADGSPCVAFPGETAGPFAADRRGRDSVTNVLGAEALKRSDIRASFGAMTGTAEGVAMELELVLLDVDNGCAPTPGRAVYVWHCDAAARYSLYELPAQNYLRGLQVADAGGWLRFRTILPGAYRGRFPHIHFEVFDSAARATSGSDARLTSQLALPPEVCRTVYTRSPLYPGSAGNLAETPLGSDMVFADNTPAQIAAQTLEVVGTAEGGLRAVGTIGLSKRYGRSPGS